MAQFRDTIVNADTTVKNQIVELYYYLSWNVRSLSLEEESEWGEVVQMYDIIARNNFVGVDADLKSKVSDRSLKAQGEKLTDMATIRYGLYEIPKRFQEERVFPKYSKRGYQG